VSPSANEVSLFIIVYGPTNDACSVISRLEKDLSSVCEWLSSNYIKLNINKCKTLVIGSPANLTKVKDINIKINGTVVERCSNLKILGVIFDENMSWKEHCKLISKKCYAAFSKLYSIKNMLNEQNRTTLVNSLIFSPTN